MTMPRHVFVSHSSQDKQAAQALCTALESQGIGCWLAPRDIEPGLEWSDAIMQGIEQCAVMVLLFSSSSNSSRQVQREVKGAFDKDKTVIPVRIEDVVPTGSMDYYLGPVQWFDASRGPIEDYLAPLAETIQRALSR